ncbi:hypothetical protein Glove_437g8 [Diversispora epigaea]|uniref:Enoyl reductase (ER) domain-containing protein n=1 Tax=Diversispora epigaea TaxID=1348612 RepID=A0A397GVU0_9GLOM|nr:hypothetical protein Glove_437g8 [Diversispora epigaea]
MKAVIVKQPGDASQLYLGEISKPTPKENELLVKVKSFGLNRMDILQREGKYPLPSDITDILGVEIAGIVEEIGRDVTNYKIGDRVFGLIYGGAYAEYACLNESMAMLLPDQLTFQHGAAIPEVWFTAYQALHLLAQIKEGQEILIHAGASGVGLAIVQLAKMAKARRIFATVGSDVKIKYVEEIGATKCINYKTEDFKEKILEFTNGRGVDIIIDFVGKDYWHKNIDCLVIDGRMILLAFLSGSNVDDVDLSVFLRKRIRVEGSNLRFRPLDYQINLRNEFYIKTLPHFFDNEPSLKVVIDREFDWTNIADSHRHLESNTTIGKVIVNING